ncbi:unnamed protein product [Rangifer tarandus platyrhynchus]|uniref:Uncharacterized protein n=2 Tax=Rangifer tarandus platyrhynchus TaxID=3082113 RepID=A0AC59ZLB4_RANTA|nr:unnamed protein product [Rangifer tarandus platyrhynchus]
MSVNVLTGCHYGSSAPPYCTIGPHVHNPSPQLLCPELRSPWETAVLKKEGFVAQGSVVIRAQECHKMSNTSSPAADSPGAPGIKGTQITGREGGERRKHPG